MGAAAGPAAVGAADGTAATSGPASGRAAGGTRPGVAGTQTGRAGERLTGPALIPGRPQALPSRSRLHSAVMSPHDTADLSAAIRTALGKVIDPELRRPITELGMVKSIDTEPGGGVHVAIYLTTAACPKKTEITDRVTQAVSDVPGTGAVKVTLDVMNDEQRTELRKQLRGDAREPVIPFAQPNSLTRVYAVASGKAGWGSPPSPSTWPPRWRPAACRSACSTPISTATPSRG